MLIVSFVSPKGGAGKTTAALLLALGLADRGVRVAMIDADPNKPLVHWASLPGRSERVTVHPAPMPEDVPAALREARRLHPDWIILDTEGSLRGALTFRTLQSNLVLTPLAGSQLDALQAIKSSELVGDFRGRGQRLIEHRCVLTRVPAALRPINLREIVIQLRAKQIKFLPIPLFEKEAFRTLFMTGGGFAEVERMGIAGVSGARDNAREYVNAVLETLGVSLAAPEGSPTPDPTFRRRLD